ncbi:MAG: hypothetical protein CVU05_15710 [Bacteroidetes bacterium HGW-Bacteroidetes-21]|jgi:hypothetical protein|nr:MAG: hypothetical protein CVU05_15710 [Bacteroidetes bacterium HGW-Bacteroidetes-21]
MYNAGFYTSKLGKLNEGYATLNDLTQMISENKIKFSDDAIIFVNGCNFAGTGDKFEESSGNSAFEWVMATGTTMIAASGHMQQLTEGVPNGKFKIAQNEEGRFWKISRVEEMYEENGETLTRFIIKAEDLGKEINIDEYVK